MNIAQHLERHATEQPNRMALVADTQTSFAELWDNADHAAAKLIALGLKTGDRAIVMVPMGIDLYVTLIALWKMGAVAVFIDPWIKRKQLSEIARFTGARLYVGSGKARLLQFITPGLRTVPLRYSPGSYAEGGTTTCENSANDTALITFTGGSSGKPKGANRTHGILQAQHVELSKCFPYLSSDVDLTTFPVFALNNLATGIPTIIPSIDFRKVANMDAQLVARQMNECGVTTCTASPPFFDQLADLKTSPPLRRILVGGAPVTDQQLHRWREAFPQTEIVIVFGSTEAEPTAHISLEDRLACHGPGYCCGTPVLSSRIVAIQKERLEDLTPLGTGEIGELVVAGDHVCRDYYQNPEAAQDNKFLKDGILWHRMGDTGYMDDLGRFWLTGRVHSSIPIKNGFAHPQLIEQAARGTEPSIERIAAIGHKNKIMVVVQSTQDLDSEEIRTRCRDAGQPCDRVILTQKPLPVDPRHNSKIDYAKVLELFHQS
jgi:acyl-CoA synthetase (AMP-forming)/AMP-acid ligase II